MGKICCFGELLLRISPELNGQWISDAKAAIHIGGAELNVATALSNWNIDTRYVTTLPENYLSNEILIALNAKGIDTSEIFFSGNRIGLYYLPQGEDLKHAGVIYDRANSAFAQIKAGTINWQQVFKDCSWFHFSAICPALNYEVAMVCKEALQAAKQMGLTISVDLNYRAKLWQYGKQPAGVMRELLPYCDVVMGNMWSAEQLAGIACPLRSSDDATDESLITAAIASLQQLHTTYPQITTVAYTFRLHNRYFSILQQGNTITHSKQFALQQIADKVGTGDCFMAGLIYGLYNKHQPQQIINFASAAAVGKTMEKGDATRQTIKDVEKMIATHA